MYLTKDKVRTYPPLKRRAKAVTFIVGFNCSDGLVFCADSQEGDGINKRTVFKLKSYDGNGWGFCFGCSGDSPVINRFSDKLRELIDRPAYDRYKVENIIEKAVQHTRRQYPNDRFEFVAGLWGKGERRLYKNHQGSDIISPQRGYACAGMDTSLPSFIIESIFEEEMSVERVTRLGILVTKVAKGCLDCCGLQTRIKTYQDGEQKWDNMDEEAINKIESEFDLEELYGVFYLYWQDKTKSPGVSRDCT